MRIATDLGRVLSPTTWERSTFERRLGRRNESWGEASEGGRSPPPRSVGALGRTLNVQRVRLACDLRAPPCSWTLLIALVRAPLDGRLEHSEGGSAPLPNLPPGTGCAGKAGARSGTPNRPRLIVDQGAYSGRRLV